MGRLVGEHFTREGLPKRAFKSFLEAQTWGHEHGLVAYECSFCGKFHLATAPVEPPTGKKRPGPGRRRRL